jgi:hypothetical protein
MTVKYEGQNLSLLCNMMWAIWEARNDVIFEGKWFNPMAVVRQGATMLVPQTEIHQPEQMYAISILKKYLSHNHICIPEPTQ